MMNLALFVIFKSCFSSLSDCRSMSSLKGQIKFFATTSMHSLAFIRKFHQAVSEIL